MPATEPQLVRLRMHVTGLVQGVGFRPFVWRAATDRGLSGWVGNDPSGVILEAEGAADAVASLLDALSRPPPLARVDEVVSESVPVSGAFGFEVLNSATVGPRTALIAPDTATCADCWREFHDPANRRYRHAFANCTSCGPRFTIVEALPYDRARTTMSDFPMCEDCAAEYEDPANRRFHAEPVCCPACGPQVRVIDCDGRQVPGDPIDSVVNLLRAGSVLAIKGIGGYHLAVDARQESAVSALRQRKHREDRPFAVLVSDIYACRELCNVDEVELELLTSKARPIVVLGRCTDARIAPSVAPGSPTLGVMLPYTPLHAMIVEAFGGPVVLTSGNTSDEPIAFDDADAIRRLAGIADAFVVHGRRIRTRVDDSVFRVMSGRAIPIRRSRGYVPGAVALPRGSGVSVLACGSALKNTFCLTRGQQAFVSHHVGDLDDYGTFQSYVDGIQHLTRLLDVTPTLVAHDLHPDYPSTGYAQELGGDDSAVRLIGVQHHHAHIASCLADNGISRTVVGVAFDGVGHGNDGTSWGGEFLVADLGNAVRSAHFATIPMPGGDAVAREPWRMAAAHLDEAYGDALPGGLGVVARQGRRWHEVVSMLHAGVNSPVTSSVGRLFDAISALVDVRDVVTYEGQAAIDLEHAVDTSELGSYPVVVSTPTVGTVGVVETAPLVRAVVDDLRAGVSVGRVAARFHSWLADVVLQVCHDLRERHDLTTVALSGGVFQNTLLVARCLERLESDAFTVLTHRQVPPNDGGISLGQAAVAIELDRS